VAVATSDDRRRAVSDLASDLAVIAGAGSGKTTALVERFVAIAGQPGLGPDRVLALTFTEKAAAEMKGRIVRRFSDAKDELRRRQTEAAYVSTIHGFAARLLKENPFEAGVDPAFTVLAEFDQELLAEEALQAMYADPVLGAYAERLGKSHDGGWQLFDLVRRVARALREGAAQARCEADLALSGRDDVVVAAALERVREWMSGQARAALDALPDLEGLLSVVVMKPAGKRFAAKEAYLAAVRAAISAGAFDADAPVWTATGFTAGIAADERPPIRELLDTVRGIAQALCGVDLAHEAMLERELLPLKRAIYAAAAVSSDSYAAAKRAQGALDYHDLQRRAVTLLEQDEVVRRRYAERFRHLLLDEAQDTDELQHALISCLRTPENHTFLVGDPKQAIYEFRGANPDVFDGAVQGLPAGDRLRFDENFRSRPELLGFINGIGGALLGDRFAPLLPRADYGAVPFAGAHVEVVHVVRGEVPGEDGEPVVEALSDARRREAAVVADRVAELLRETPLVLDPDHPRGGVPVPLQPRHIALLFRTRTTIPYFERAFAERGIPYVSAVGQEFYERTEVLDCLMLLRALEQPLDDLALASVLKSPFFGTSDGDLLRLRGVERGDRAGRAGPRPLYRYLDRVESVASFRSTFEAVRARTRGRPAADALDEALRAFGYEAALASHRDGRAMLANVAKLRRQVADLGAATVGEALRELERARALLVEERQAPLLGPADDVVVFTTIHQAKGLEWPVVCLPNLQGTRRGGRPDFSPRHGCLVLDALVDGEKETPASVEPVAEELKARSEWEERRLLYVAATRARERLILTSSVEQSRLDAEPKPSFASYFAFLAGALGPVFQREGDIRTGGARLIVRHQRGPVSPPARLVEGAPLIARVAVRPKAPEHAAPGALPGRVAPPLSVKVTELLTYARCPLVYRYAVALDIPEHPPRRAALRGGAREVSPVERGTIVHRLLERADLTADAAAESRRVAAGEPESIRGDLERMLTGVLSGEVGDLVRHAVRVERELPFGMLMDGIEISGVIDLAVQRADGAWTVLDYKSNDISRAGRLEHLAEHYRPQLELYALAMERAGMGDVSHCALVFLNGPEVRQWPFEDVDAARAEGVTRALLRGVASADYATGAGAKCAECGYRKRGICQVGREWRE
jgi:ATP-dependent helicase/nuclease subunit A